MWQNLMVGGGDMGVGADHKRGAPVDEMGEGLLLARRLGMEIDNGGVAAKAERTGRKLALDRREGIVERLTRLKYPKDTIIEGLESLAKWNVLQWSDTAHESFLWLADIVATME